MHVVGALHRRQHRIDGTVHHELVRARIRLGTGTGDQLADLVGVARVVLDDAVEDGLLVGVQHVLRDQGLVQLERGVLHRLQGAQQRGVVGRILDLGQRGRRRRDADTAGCAAGVVVGAGGADRAEREQHAAALDDFSAGEAAHGTTARTSGVPVQVNRASRLPPRPDRSAR